MKSIAIIGGGAAGLSAAIYALRANAEVSIFEQYGLGGMTANIDKIENYPSYQQVEGFALAQNMANQAKKLGLKVIRQKVLSLTKADDGSFSVKTDKGEYVFPAVIIATGTSHNKLGIEGDYVGRGVSYCATCDGNFYKGLAVAVIGGGNAAVKEGLYLADIAKTVFMISPTEGFTTADELSVSNLLSKPNVKVYGSASVSQIYGNDVVEGIKIFCKDTSIDIPLSAVFVAIGAAPSLDFVRIDGLATDKGYVVVNAKCETNVKGLFAAGDVTSNPLKQIVTACADGAKAGTYAAVHASVASKLS